MSISINKFTSWYNKAVPPRKFVAVVHRIGEHVIEGIEGGHAPIFSPFFQVAESSS